MLGIIIGDIASSVYNSKIDSDNNIELAHEKSFFTRRTVMTLATAYALLNRMQYGEVYKAIGNLYNNTGKHGMTPDTISINPAVCVAPIAYLKHTLEDVIKESENCVLSLSGSGNNIKGAQAVASAIFMAGQGIPKIDIKKFIVENFGYDLSFSLHDQQTEDNRDCVQIAAVAFLESENYVQAINKTIFMGKDTSNAACIAGGIAEAYYGAIPRNLLRHMESRLDNFQMDIIRRFTTVAKHLAESHV